MGLQKALRIGLSGLWLAILGTSLPAEVLAHGVQVQAQTTSAVEIQATYDSGEPMSGAQVQVYAPTDPENVVFTGVTDASGRYLFVPDRAGDWELSVRQAGHGEIVVIPVAEAGVVAAEVAGSSKLTTLQRGIVAGAVIWGCVGTALYFRRGKH
ncbi:MAG: carboxypeptidase-like regulatory domain-containing protein [Cyanobacteria bacterium J06626_18]